MNKTEETQNKIQKSNINKIINKTSKQKHKTEETQNKQYANKTNNKTRRTTNQEQEKTQRINNIKT